MADCHVESHIERGGRTVAAGMWRATVVHTASGRVLYETWPYGRERTALDRARRWLRQEYQKHDAGPLFDAAGEAR